MRDYKKTISDLRNFNANYEAGKLTNDAADAIEELLARVQKLEYTIRLLHIEKETFKTFSGL